VTSTRFVPSGAVSISSVDAATAKVDAVRQKTATQYVNFTILFLLCLHNHDTRSGSVPAIAKARFINRLRRLVPTLVGGLRSYLIKNPIFKYFRFAN